MSGFINMTIEELKNNGDTMLDHGWTVNYSSDQEGMGNDYLWTSPRGGKYRSKTIDLPPYQAVENAQANDDYPTEAK